MKIQDVTFIEHNKGYWGAPVFCHVTEGSIHVNILPNYWTNWVKFGFREDSESSLDRLFWSVENLLWFARNISQILTHESIHIVISRLIGREASFKFDWIERTHKISNLGR